MGLSQQRNLDFFNIKNYGAVSGADCTTAIANARADARAVGGGVVFYPPGLWISGNQDVSIDKFVYHIGSGVGATVVQLKNGANTDLFSGQTGLINLNASFGSTAAGTLYNFGFADMTIDGNKANQSAGPCYPLRFYGYSYRLTNLEVRNGYSGNILADWNAGATFATDSLEAFWFNVKTHHSLGIGIQYSGPHDSQMINVVPFLEGTHCLHACPNASGLQLTNLHAWQPTAGNIAFLNETADCYCSNCEAESSDTVQVVVLGSGMNWNGGNVYGMTPFTASGFQIGQVGGATPYTGQVYQSGGVTQAKGVQRCRINSRISNCQGTHGALYLSNDGGYSHFDITCDQSGGTYMTGTLNPLSDMLIHGQGLTPTGSRGVGGGYVVSAQANGAFTVVDTVRDAFNINTQGKRVELNNNYALQIWQGTNYTGSMNTLNADGSGSIVAAGSLALGQSATTPDPGNGGTIVTTKVGTARVTPTANETGLILAVGTVAGQKCTVVNNSASFSITFAVSATSNVAQGASLVIAANGKYDFTWDSVAARWY